MCAGECVVACASVRVCAGACASVCAFDVGRSDRGTQKDYLSLVNDIGKTANSWIANRQTNTTMESQQEKRLLAFLLF